MSLRPRASPETVEEKEDVERCWKRVKMGGSGNVDAGALRAKAEVVRTPELLAAKSQHDLLSLSNIATISVLALFNINIGMLPKESLGGNLGQAQSTQVTAVSLVSGDTSAQRIPCAYSHY